MNELPEDRRIETGNTQRETYDRAQHSIDGPYYSNTIFKGVAWALGITAAAVLAVTLLYFAVKALI